MLHPLPLPLSSCLGCIPPLIGLPSLRFYAVGSSLFLLSVCFCLCSLFYLDDVLCWLLLARPFLYAFHAHLRFPVDLVWFRLSCDHGWIRSGSVNVRKQQQQQQQLHTAVDEYILKSAYHTVKKGRDSHEDPRRPKKRNPLREVAAKLLPSTPCSMTLLDNRSPLTSNHLESP